jgi:PAS domain S-box-containing protein
MMTPSRDDASRQRTLRDVHKLGGTSREQFEALARTTARQLGSSVAWLAVLDEHDDLSLLAGHGMVAGATLAHAAEARAAVMRGDDCAFFDLPGPELRSGVACRITVQEEAVGVLCAMDGAERRFDDGTLPCLRDLAALATSLLDAGLKQERWRLQAERVRVASLSSSDWLWESDSAGQVTWVSDGVQAHTGQTPTQVVGLTLPKVNSPLEDDATNSWGRYQEARARREPFRDVLAYRHVPEGEKLIVSISGVPMFDEHGLFRGYRGTTSNITERFEAQREARAAQRLLADALDALTAGVMISDPQGRVVLANAVWRRNIGDYMANGATWPEVVRRMAEAGDYPDAADRDAFVQWRLGLASDDGVLHEMRWKDRWLIVSDRLLADGSVVHLSIDITDRKLTELTLADQQRQLDQSKAQLSAVLEAVPDLWFVLDVEGRYLACSNENHPMLVRPWETVRGQPFAAGVPAALAERALAAIHKALATGEVQRIDYELTVRDGVSRIFEARISPMPQQQVLYVTRDVTEQSRAADKLRLSEELYRSVAAAISDGLLVVTPTLGIIAINPAGCDMLGVDMAEVTGHHGAPWPFELLDADEAPLPHDQHPVLHVITTDQPLMNRIYSLQRPDGQRRWVVLNAHPLRLRPQGSTFSVVLTFRDITRERASELALALAEERWQFALEGSGDGVWDWDARTDTLYYSTRWKEMRGYAEHEIGDSPEEWRSRIHPDDLPRVLAEIRRHMDGEAPFYDIEYRVRHKLGHDLWIRDRGKVVSRDSDGRALRVVGTQSDITRSKQAEQALRDKQAAELASDAKSEFLSRMSHEMRTPLNAVIGFSQLLSLSSGPLDADSVREYAGHVLDAGEHLLALIDDVLDLQKIEEGALTLTLRAVDLHDVVCRAAELLMPSAQAGEVRFDNRVPKGIWVHADLQRLRQVLLNVASNAIKYNHPGGMVRWRVEGPTPAGRVTLCVDDDGSGMSEEQMGQLFQPFERLGRETSTIEGTGLGLIIARSLVQAVGGKLDIESRAGLGTTVRIELQVSEPAAAPVPPSPAPPEPRASGLRMLYVEDNRINAILFEEAMRMHGDHVELRVAEDGDQAMSVAQEWQPEVLVLDAHLPGISGFEVLRLLRTLPGLDKVPAYMCSADAMPDDVKRAYEAGFVGYWTKPINVSAVLADIDQCLQQRRALGAA